MGFPFNFHFVFALLGFVGLLNYFLSRQIPREFDSRYKAAEVDVHDENVQST